MLSLQSIPTRPQSSFKVAYSIEELISSTEDVIYWVDPPEATKVGFLQDIGSGAYIYKLHDAVFYPNSSLLTPIANNVTPEFKDGLEFNSRKASLLLTNAGELFSDSLGRNKMVPCFLSGVFLDKNPNISLPSIKHDYSDPVVFIEFFRSHFGHFLVDVLGRFWPTSLADKKVFSEMNFAGVGYDEFSNGISQSAPGFIKKSLSACGLTTDKIKSIKEPTRFTQLYVPSRIAPLYLTNGPRYNDLMKMIGEHIVPKKHKITNTKIFLSRSRLGPRMRPLNKKTETMVEDMFALRGFEIIHSQELSFEDQIEIGRNADWLAGLAGSQMHLSVFSDVPKVHMFNIKPSFFEVPEYLEVIKTLGGDMHEFIANDFGSFSQSQKSELAIRRPWDISPDDLHKLEQEIENWLAT